MVYSLLSRIGTKPTFGLNLWVGFYFLLLLLLMYVKRARMNVPNRNMIVNASFTSMASPPPKLPKETYFESICSKGNHAHPRFNCSYILPLFTSTYKRSQFVVMSYLQHPSMSFPLLRTSCNNSSLAIPFPR